MAKTLNRYSGPDSLTQAHAFVLDCQARGLSYAHPMDDRPHMVRCRKISGVVAAWLCHLVRLDPDRRGMKVGDVRYQNGGLIPIRGGDYSKLRFWGLIEQALDPDAAEKRAKKKPGDSGCWRWTERARQWIRGEITLPKFIVLLDKRFIGFRSEADGRVQQVALKDVWADPDFDYRTLAGAGK